MLALAATCLFATLPAQPPPEQSPLVGSWEARLQDRTTVGSGGGVTQGQEKLYTLTLRANGTFRRYEGLITKTPQGERTRGGTTEGRWRAAEGSRLELTTERENGRRVEPRKVKHNYTLEDDRLRLDGGDVVLRRKR
jgi:hypothetical protein